MRHKKLILLSLIAVFIYGSLAFAQKLSVDGDIAAPSMKLDPQSTAIPSGASGLGRIYYDDEDKLIYISEDSSWNALGQIRNVATIIVAANDSLDKNKAEPAYQCDGTDDQVTIQAAIDACPAAGGVVYLLEGTYNISAAINFNNTAPGDSNKALIGAGAGTVLKIPDGTSTDFEVISVYKVNRVLISQLKIDGNRDNITATNNAAVRFSNVTDSKIDNVYVENMGGCGIPFVGSSNNTVSNCNIQSTSVGIITDTSSSNIFVNNNSQGNIGGDIYSGGGIYSGYGSSNNIFSNNNVQSNGSAGITVCCASAGGNNIISNNNIHSNSSTGIWISESSAGTHNIISNNNIHSNGSAGIWLTNFASNNIISNNNVHFNPNKAAIYLVNSSWNNVVFGNVVYENGNGGWGLAGISIKTDADNNIISSNRIYSSFTGTPAYGIDILETTCDNNYFIGNYIDGARYIGATYDRRIRDLGTGTIYTDKAKMTLERCTSYTLTGNNGLRFNTPTSYIALSPSSNITLGDGTGDGLPDEAPIENGKSPGDILILENTSGSYTVRLKNAYFNLILPGDRILSQYDTLKLIWNGAVWLEVSYADVP